MLERGFLLGNWQLNSSEEGIKVRIMRLVQGAVMATAMALAISACSNSTGPSSNVTVQLVTQGAFGVIGQQMTFTAQLNTNGSITAVDITGCDPTPLGTYSIASGAATLTFGNMGGSATVSCSVAGQAGKGTVTVPVWVLIRAWSYARAQSIIRPTGIVSIMSVGISTGNGLFSEVTCDPSKESWDPSTQIATCSGTQIPVPPNVMLQTYVVDSAVQTITNGRNVFINGHMFTPGDPVATGMLDVYGNPQ